MIDLLGQGARQGHTSVVAALVNAGAHLGGSDVALGYADLALRRAKSSADADGISVWALAGVTASAQVERGRTHAHSASASDGEEGLGLADGGTS